MRTLLLAATFHVLSCTRHDVDIEQPASGRRLTSAEEAELQRVADGAFRDARARLEGLPSRLLVIVRFGKDVIPETGESGAAAYPGNISLTLDPDRDVHAVIHDSGRACILHELHHLARRSRIEMVRSVRERVVAEGLATVFERDVTPSRPAWGERPPEIDAWMEAVLAAGTSSETAPWFDAAPPDRRFIGHRVGVELVDRAARASGRSAAQLVFAPAEEIVALAATPAIPR